MAQPISIKELIKRKAELKNNRNNKKKQTLHIQSLDSHIKIKQPDKSLVMDAMEMAGDGGDEYTTYECVIEPNLKSTELHKEYGVEHDPMQIVHAIFEPGEVSRIAQACINLSGYGNSVKVVDDIKN